MSDADKIKTVDDEATLRRAESALDAQIGLCTSAAATAVKHALNWPNAGSLAGVDRAIGLMQALRGEARRLKERGISAPDDRLMAVINDLTAARATLAKTLGVLATADRADAAGLVKTQAELTGQRKNLIDERIDQGQSQANEINKLL
ncbi:MAG: hypothetical protein FD165_2490 [Gammaproteobacteria bacterium]|nr:MAG: hypothetical protein FD165_2490 [Gammaproteobacteria bacterium]TND02923.1 MAG: hypothetical protein FD120_1992 [Gammaproteobacteria bacterium]